MNKIITPLFLALAAISCNQQDHEPVAKATADRVDPVIYAAAIENPARLETDRARDADRQPAAVLEFFQIAPGMAVLDMFSGGGYYAEILSAVVGDGGRVVAHSNKAYLNFVGEEFNARHADGRLANVDVLMAEINELELATDQFDAILMALGYHDTYWESEEYQWPAVDRPTLNAELFAALKPGGVLAMIDHAAAPGSSGEEGIEVHRIDRALAISDMQQAGFVLESESDLLANPADDHSKGVFDPEIKGKTDRFILKFRKPE
jgi:predicted methyltransferase